MENYIDPGNDFKTYPVISANSNEQVRYLRTDPYPYKKFYHVLEEEKAAHVRKEILHTLIAIGSLALILWWVL